MVKKRNFKNVGDRMTIKKRKKRSYSRRTSYAFVLLIFVVIFLLSAVATFRYYQELHSTIREENQLYLQEITKRISTSIERIVRDNFSILSTMTVPLESAESIEEVQEIIEKQKGFWSYEDIMLVNRDGRLFETSGKETFFTLDENMRNRIISHNKAMSTSQTINNKEYIVFSTPISNVKFGEYDMIALVATYRQASFEEVLSMSSFSERAYSQVIKKSGTVVTVPSSPYALEGGYNVLSTIQSSDIGIGYSMDAVIEEINNGQIGMMSFTIDDVERYMVYTPISGISEWYLLTFVPVESVNEKSDMLLKSTILLCTLIAVVFALLISTLVALFSSHRNKLERIAFVDTVTGGNTITRFYEIAQKILSSKSSDDTYALIYSNMIKFKVLNEQYGRETCDTILKIFHDTVSDRLDTDECIGHVSADNFCILIKYVSQENIIKVLESWQQSAEEYILTTKAFWRFPVVEFGIYVIENTEIGFPQMTDRAKLSIKENWNSVNDRFRYSFYDDEIRRKMMREKELEDKMYSALNNNEFKLYLQPKYKLPQECVGGAEALVRWESSDEGMIYPNEFIPLFEKNGFVVNVDLWIFEEVCRNIRKWLDEGLEPIKISVNCSRVHFKDSNFLSAYVSISDKYSIDRKYLEIELTESVVFENTQMLINIIDDIRAVGFGCSIDDFGSGYSSLNMIQSIPVDTLKLDRIFFKAGPADLHRTESVIKSIVGLAKSLSMATVAEGVEHKEQVEMLKKSGCDYVQGYVFAKPMPVEDFYKLTYGEGKQQ